MSQPYTGEIRLVASNFAPINWHFCDGSLLPISQYEVLYTLLGTTYGGDGVNTFGLPDLRGRVPVHSGTSRSGSNFIIGQIAGQESVLLTAQQLPAHNHILSASTNVAAGSDPTGSVTGQVGSTQIYREVAPASAMAPDAIGAGAPAVEHDNLQPFLCVSFIIALEGIFPSQG